MKKVMPVSIPSTFCFMFFCVVIQLIYLKGDTQRINHLIKLNQVAKALIDGTEESFLTEDGYKFQYSQS